MSSPSSLRLVRAAGLAPGRGEPAAPGTTPGPTDEELAKLARARDPRAATLIWDRYAGIVRGVVSRALGPGHDVEDLVQDIFIGFFRGVHSLRDPSALRSFLISIALRTACSELRKKRVRRWLRLSDDGTMPDAPTPGGDPRTREALRRLYAILDQLDDQDRVAFVMRHADGHDLAELSAALGVSLATVKRRLQRAETYVHARAKADDLLRPWAEVGHA